jgi:hypothetical protein
METGSQFASLECAKSSSRNIIKALRADQNKHGVAFCAFDKKKYFRVKYKTFNGSLKIK